MAEALMNPQLMYVMIAVAIAIIIVAALVIVRNKRSERLQSRFGPEYERTVHETGNVRKAEATLQARETRVERFHIRPLTREDATWFSDEWRRVQAQFVVDPANATIQADRLVGEAMTARGYPVGDFEQRVEDISVDHPDIVMNYRAARAIIEEHARHPVSTEDMRQAMVHYRALFKDLIGVTTPIPERGVEQPPVGAARDRRERP